MRRITAAAISLCRALIDAWLSIGDYTESAPVPTSIFSGYRGWLSLNGLQAQDETAAWNLPHSQAGITRPPPVSRVLSEDQRKAGSISFLAWVP